MGHSVVFLTTALAFGGAETQLARLAFQLSRRGWRVRIISMLPPVAFADDLAVAGIETVSLNMRRGVPDPRALIACTRLLRHWKPEVLVCFMFHANLLGRISGRLSRVPVIVSSIRNQNFGGAIRDVLLRMTDWLGDITTTNSHLAAKHLARRGVVPPDRLYVIPNGIDVSRYQVDPGLREKTRRELGLCDSTFLWLAVGRLEEQKDYPTLLRAFRKVVSQQSNVRLLIAGQGPLLQELAYLAQHLEIESVVSFLGLRRDIPALLSACDALVLSSAWEGLPNVVMEALAASRPVVATRVGGVPELIEDGKSGLLVEPRDPEALARAMLQMTRMQRADLEMFGEVGKAHVTANFDIDCVVQEWDALFLRLLSQVSRN